MDAAHSTEFQRRIVALAEVFDVKLSAARIALYFEALRDLPIEDVIRGMNQTLHTAKFFPRPAEIRACAVGDTEDQIEAAWLLLRRSLGKVGAYSSVVFQDPALGESVLSLFGSWPMACSAELSPEMWASKRKEFGRVYRVFRDRHLDGTRYLPGINEQANAGREDWKRFLSVAQIGRDGVIHTLPAEATRMRIAAQSGGFTDIRTGLSNVLRFMPGSESETA